VYDPKIGQFLSEDLIGLLDDINPRRYVRNSPTNYTDPTGLYKHGVSGGLIGPPTLEESQAQAAEDYAGFASQVLAGLSGRNGNSLPYDQRIPTTSLIQAGRDLANGIPLNHSPSPGDWAVIKHGHDLERNELPCPVHVPRSGYHDEFGWHTSFCMSCHDATNPNSVAKMGVARQNALDSWGRFIADQAIGAIGGELLSLAGPARTATTTVSSSKSRVPWQYGNTGDNLGITDKFGNITIQPGLTGQVLEETVRHEAVHRFFSPSPGFIGNVRADVGMAAYQNSHLVRYMEEAIAEGFATRSVSQGLAFPLREGYVSGPRVIAEGVGYISVTTGGFYLGTRIGQGK